MEVGIVGGWKKLIVGIGGAEVFVLMCLQLMCLECQYLQYSVLEDDVVGQYKLNGIADS